MQFLALQVWPADRVLFGNYLGRTRNNVLSMDVDQGNGGFDYVFCIWPKLMLGKLIRGNRCDRRRNIKDKALEVASKYLVGDCFDLFSNAFYVW